MNDTQPSDQEPDRITAPQETTSGLSAIIPAFNEAQRIGFVLGVLSQIERLDKIIVVDDGSSDGTAQEVQAAAGRDHRIQFIRLPFNQGKGQSLFRGLKEATAKYILMLDADLQGLAPVHVLSLIEPVIKGEADMTVGLFRGGRFRTDLSHWLTPWLSGQRCVRAELFQKISRKAAEGYGLETAMTVAARAQGWRIRKVALKGVWHPPSEGHRGVLPGIWNRMRMYSQILRAWYYAGSSEPLWRRLLLSKRFFLALFLLLAGFSLVYNRSRAVSPLVLNDIPALPLQNAKRVLVIAPHPDDETIGAGGVIQAAISQGSEVKVVIVTNGDGQLLAPLALDRKVLPTPVDYVQGGEERQRESLAALQRLGVPNESVIFLSYPDHYLETMWLSDWKEEIPVLVRDTRVTKSPYPRTYNPSAHYVGKDVLGDIQTILLDYKPDVIFISHPNDDHPDHRAVYDFTKMALSLIQAQTPDYRPAVWAYLVHYGYYPQPRGISLSKDLLPPEPLANSGLKWFRFDLSSQQEGLKLQAIRDYTTQIKLLGTFLLSFARQNEIFVSIPEMELSAVDARPVQVSEGGVIRQPNLQEPMDESTRRLFMEGADLTGWHVTRLGQAIWLTALTDGHLLPGLDYHIMVKTPDGQTDNYNMGPLVWWGANSFTAQVDLASLGNPIMIGFSAEVKQKITLDRTAWNFVILR